VSHIVVEERSDANAAHANRLNWRLQEALIRLERCVGYVPYYVREREDFDQFIESAREYAKQKGSPSDAETCSAPSDAAAANRGGEA
jgi:hypothetical protein